MSSLRPDSNKGHDLGSSSVKWGTLHVGDVSAETITTSGNVEISGNLTVSGTQTSLQVSTVEAEDPLIKLARNNTGDAIDIGFYGQSQSSGTTYYHGLARDADDGKFYLVKDLETEPTSTLGTISGGNKATIVANLEGSVTGAITGNADTASALETARTLSISGDASGSVSFDGSADADIAITIGSNAVENSMILNSTITVAGDSGSTAIDLGDTLTIQGTTNEIVTSQSGDILTIALPDSVSGLTSVSATSFTGALTGNASTASALQTARAIQISGDVAGSANFDGSAAINIAATIQGGAVENSMLANKSITFGDGVSSGAVDLGGSVTIGGTSNQVDVSHISGTFQIGLPSTIEVDTSGNAATATALETARTFSISGGPVTASGVSFDGTGNVSLTSSIANGALGNALLANSSTSFSDGSTSTAVSLGGQLTIQGTSNEVEVSNSAGVFSIGLPSTITADVSGNASSADTLSTGRTIALGGGGPVTASGVSFDGSQNITLTSQIASGAILNTYLENDGWGLKLDGSAQEDINLGDSLDFVAGTDLDIAYNSTTNALTFSLEAEIGSDTTGNAATATALASSQNFSISSGPVTASAVSFDGTGAVALTSAIANGAISNAMLANDGISLKLAGVAQEDINLGDSLDFAGTSNQVTVAYDSSLNKLTYGLASSINVDTTGNAATATVLESSRDFSISSGPVTAAAVSFDGSGNVSLTSAIANGALSNAMLANSSITVSDTSNSEAISLGDTLYFGGTSSEVEVSYSSSLNKFTFGLPDSVSVTTNLDVGSALSVGGNISATGNISAAGLTATGANITFADNLIEFGVNNTDLEDIGFYGQRGDGIGGSNGFAGFAFDESADKFIAFTSTGEPTTTVGSYTAADTEVGALEASSIDCAGVVAGELRAEGSAPTSTSDTGTAGDIRYDSSYIYICVATNTWKRATITTW